MNEHKEFNLSEQIEFDLTHYEKEIRGGIKKMTAELNRHDKDKLKKIIEKLEIICK